MKNIFLGLALVFGFSLISFERVSAQNDPPPRPTPPRPAPRLSAELAKNLEMQTEDVPRERREQALVQLMAGQRYIWQLSRTRSQSLINSTAKLAKQSFQKAVELDPKLAEGYTALAELTLTTPPNDIDEATNFATLATKINPDNFGSQRILARIYTIKSQLNNGKFNQINGNKAILGWKEVARIDPRNAEAWAFLSELYAQTNQDSEKIDALQKWLGAAQPVDSETGFYRTVTQNQSLAPESATVKLGEAYIKIGKYNEAIEALSRAIADNPEDSQAINLLSRAIPNVDKASSLKTIEALQQAVYTNPESFELVELLARLQFQAGKTDESVKLLKSLIEKTSVDDKFTAANLQVNLAEMLLEGGRDDEAIAAYEAALKIRGIGQTNLVTEDDNDFATTIFSKIIQTYKISDKFDEAKATIEKSRAVFSKIDLFADKQLISLLRENGKKAEALTRVRALRKVYPTETSLLRTEATILTELGRVKEGVDLIKRQSSVKSTNSAIALIEEFNNLVFISSLYGDAKLGKLAVASANQAYSIAKTDEMKLMAKLILATAQEKSNDFVSAEKTLREILNQSPDNSVALNNLGYFLVERNQKLDEATKLIKKAVDLEPTNASFIDSLGWAYFKQNKFDEAEKQLKDAARRSPTSATIQEHLGDVYEKQGKIDSAKIAWQRAIRLNSDTRQIRLLKVKLSR
jgi:tetratricopeptide (TPR) repeat protein